MIAGAVGLVGCDGGGASDAPAAPTGVQATSQEGAVALRWEEAAGAEGYNVYRDTNSTSGVSGTPVNGETPIEQAAYTDDAVENGTRYYYRVTAVGGGESEPSSEVSARPFPSPPDRPE